MTITAKQREARRKSLGSSDSSAIVGVDPWRNAYDVYLEKIHETDDISGNQAIELGNALEAPLVEWAGRELGIEIERDVSLVSAAKPIFTANLDGRGAGSAARIGIEAKSTSLGHEWGDEGTDQVPDRVLVQTAHQMFVADLDEVYVPVLTAKYDRLERKLYHVSREEALIGSIIAHDEEFWEDHVIPKIAPSLIAPRIDVVKRVRRQEGKRADVDRELVESWIAANEEKRAAEQAADEAKARLLATLGDAELGDFGDTEKILTYLLQSRATVDGKSLKRDHPELYERYARVSEFRVPRISRRA